MNSEELDSRIVEALEKENDGLFEQGDAIVEGIDSALSRKYVYGRFAYLSRRGIRTAGQRHKVSAIFTPDRRNPELNWTFHSYCASAADLRKPETWDKAYQWLERAAGTIANDREYSTEDLANDMKASGLDPNADKPVYLVDKEAAIITSAGKETIELQLFNGVSVSLPVGAEVIVTIVQKVLSEEVQALAVSKT